MNGSFIASFAENQNFGLAGDRVRRSAVRKRNLGLAIRHQVLVEGGHAGIRIFAILRMHLPRDSESKNQGKNERKNCCKLTSVHHFLLE
jgi:hypothetical protein